MAQAKLEIPSPAFDERAEDARATPSSGTFRVARKHFTPIRRIAIYPAPVLRVPALDCDPCDPDVVAVAFALVATMRVSPGCIGLAAPQIGEMSRVLCMDVTGHAKARSCAGLVTLVNPRVVARSENMIMREGCMSVPHLTGDVARAAEVLVEGWEPGTGRYVELFADGIEARCLQHAIDHLDGHVFVERVDDPARDLHERRRWA